MDFLYICINNRLTLSTNFAKDNVYVIYQV